MFKRLLLFFAMAVITNVMYGQQREISGQVKDAGDGMPIPGVNITIKGTSTGTITDIDGNFKIQAIDANILIFSYIGYEKQELSIGTSNFIAVQLKASDVGLGEVVVVGYGTVKKEDATGSVSAITSKDFNQGVITSPQDLLMGKAAGVVITTNNGAPGSGSKIRIRGGSSLSASNDPLIIIDGIPISNQSIDGIANPLSFINPNDIESFTILKDASAAAIYGSRASNGVIIITTKKSSSDKMKINYNGNVSLSYAPKLMDVLTGDEFRALAYDKLGTNNITFDGLSRLGAENTDWQDQIYRTSVSTGHNLSLSGKAYDIPYRVSLGYSNENGIVKKTDMNRYSTSINANPSFLDNTLQINFNGKGSYSKSNFNNTGAVGGAVAFDPTQPVNNNNSRYGGYYTWTQDGEPNGEYNQLAASNPVAMLDLTDNKGEVYRGATNLQVDYKIPFLEGLSANFNAGIDATKSTGSIYVDTIAVWTRRSQYGQIQDQNQETKNELIDFYFNYKKEFGIHNVDFTAGYSWQHYWRKGSLYNRSVVDATNPSATELIVAQNSSYETENYLVSFFGRLNYNLLGRYLLTATLRQDGSSKFIGDNKWGLFPSLAAAWSIDEEKFMANVKFVSALKLRLGWGITGQQDITNNDYPALGTYRLSSEESAMYQIGTNPDGTPIFVKTLRPNAYDPDIKWEETTTQNIGLDFGILKNRITGSVDIYKRVTNDLINNIAIANGSNFSNYLTTNVGSLENKGVEIELNGRAIVTNNFSWNVGINFTYNKNEITKLLKTDDPTYIGVQAGGISGGTGNNIQINSVGYPANSFFVLQQVYDENGMPVEGAYVNLSGETGSVDGNLNNFYRYKSPTPDYLIGISSRFAYKDFDFSFSGRLSLGNYAYNNIASEAFYGNLYNNAYWRSLPSAISETNFNNSQYFSDFYVENASFFKMDNMSLGYNFKDIFASKVKGRVSFVVVNVFTITKYSGLDPEVDGGIDNNFYPRSRTFMLGLNLDF
ncbi:MAG: TonB-dependent receptor [Bacteroidales bacterium]|nr:TonB-dependent receptor [Bacteroidales bacterium]